ncbi:tetratricopeptide repeat protein [Pseudodonghicola flavimaris]|uniref:Tetratricopeptide repeat protein n=1 Tax=Pseudodonghicola flavimaris TaxID=3050036 RepID=A0ABT7F182_9RHOB|nr:tetratricopeptide repeat protein [Pseudodonghicola flavimaris]MDK3018371.1 tetratricopeptide repeat protein [Pseudodonghicola flavimaris]
MPSRPSLTLHVSGTFRAHDGEGQDIAGLSRRSRGLLAYLATQADMRAERGLIADLLWSDRSEGQARASLRQELSLLRRSLPDGLLGTDRQTVWLDATRVAISGAAGGAEFLSGFDLASEGFEDWLRQRRMMDAVSHSETPTAAVPSSPEPASRPTLAVLPFDEFGVTEDDMFADGVVEEITGALSRIRDIEVIARQSAFALRRERLDVPSAAARLGATYIVEGSVRRAGDRVRIAVQLVNGPNGHTLWSERFDDRLDDLFDLQDRIASQVAGQVAPSLRAAEIARARSHPPEDRTAYELYITALPQFWASQKRSILKAIDLLDAALARDPDYGPALAYKAWATAHLATYMWSSDPDRDHDLAHELANRAASVTDDHAPSLVAIAGTYAFTAEDPGLGLDFARRALRVDPNNAWGWMRLAWAQYYDGVPEKTLQSIETAERLSPLDPFRYNMLIARAAALRELGEPDRAVDIIREAMRLKPDLTWASRTLIGTLLAAGREDEARAEMQRLLSNHPDITAESFLKLTPRAIRKNGQQYLDRFRRIGLSDR